MPERRGHQCLLSALVVGMMATAGCQSRPAEPRLSENVRGAILSLAGLSSVEDQNRQETALLNAEQAQVSSCMAKNGFTYIPAPASEFVAVSDSALTLPRYSEVYAKSLGFGITSSYPPPPPPSPKISAQNDKYRDSLSDAAIAQYSQQLPLCFTEAGKNVRESLGFVKADAIFDSLDKRVRAKPAFAEASAKWATCAAKAGLHYQSLDDARADFNRRVLALSSLERFSTPTSKALLDLQTQERQAATVVSACTDQFGSTVSSIYRVEVGKL